MVSQSVTGGEAGSFTNTPSLVALDTEHCDVYYSVDDSRRLGVTAHTMSVTDTIPVLIPLRPVRWLKERSLRTGMRKIGVRSLVGSCQKPYLFAEWSVMSRVWGVTQRGSTMKWAKGSLSRSYTVVK